MPRARLPGEAKPDLGGEPLIGGRTLQNRRKVRKLHMHDNSKCVSSVCARDAFGVMVSHRLCCPAAPLLPCCCPAAATAIATAIATATARATVFGHEFTLEQLSIGIAAAIILILVR